MEHSPGFLKLVAELTKSVREIEATELLTWLENQVDFTLIDVREESEWAAGRLPKAIYLGRGIIERDIEKTVPDQQACLVLYCGGGYRSALAAANLEKMGYQKVISLKGGYRTWLELNFPLAPF